MNKTIKLSIGILISIIYIIISFYLSEPQYIDNVDQKLDKYDYVSIFEKYGDDVVNGMVMQVDDKYVLIKYTEYGRDQFAQLNIKESTYRVVGKGTIYHKVNDHIGFNIILLTQFFVMILMVIFSVFIYNNL